MNGLLPIIRRVRRPLLPVEAAADARSAVAKAVPAVEPVCASEGDGTKINEPKRKDQRGKVA